MWKRRSRNGQFSSGAGWPASSLTGAIFGPSESGTVTAREGGDAQRHRGVTPARAQVAPTMPTREGQGDDGFPNSSSPPDGRPRPARPPTRHSKRNAASSPLDRDILCDPQPFPLVAYPLYSTWSRPTPTCVLVNVISVSAHNPPAQRPAVNMPGMRQGRLTPASSTCPKTQFLSSSPFGPQVTSSGYATPA